MPHSIHILPPSFWRPLLDKAGKGIEEKQWAFARTLMGYFHRRHVGISISSAIDLAHFLVTHVVEADYSEMVSGPESPWALIIGQIIHGDGEHTLHELGPGMSVSEVDFRKLLFLISRLVEPIVVAADREIGVTYLLGESGHRIPGGIGVEQYKKHGVRQVDYICRYFEDRGQFNAVPAEEIRLTMAAWQGSAGLSSEAGIPVGDLRLLAHYLNLPDLKMEMMEHQVKPASVISDQSSYRFGTHPRQGGVMGIYSTRRIEDFDQALVSEYLYPKPVFLERLTNSGFNALWRPPTKSHTRDVLVVGLCLETGPAATWRAAQSAWLLSLMGVAHHLHNLRKIASEIVWIRMDTIGASFANLACLGDLQASMETEEDLFGRQNRVQFLRQLGWMPQLTDIRKGAELAGESHDGPMKPIKEVLKTKVNQLLARRRIHTSAENPLDQYKRIVVNLIVPTSWLRKAGNKADINTPVVRWWTNKLRLSVEQEVETEVSLTTCILPLEEEDQNRWILSNGVNISDCSIDQGHSARAAGWLAQELLALNLMALRNV